MDITVSVHVESSDDRVGGWVDLVDFYDSEGFFEAVKTMTRGADEIIVTDVEAPFRSVDHISLADVWAFFEVLDNAHDANAMAAYLGFNGWDLNYADNFDDAWCGEWDSIEDYALNWFEEIHGDLLAFPGFKIEVDTVAWQMDHYEATAPDGSTHVFRYV